MAKKIAVGIDVGTSQIKIVIAENIKNENGTFSPIVLAKVATESKGLRHGYVTNPEEVTESVLYAIREAEKISKIKIKKVYLSVGGISLGSIISKGYVMTSKADSEITDIDIKKVVSVAENEIPQNQILNKRIIHSVPLAYKVDDELLVGRPKGMHGNKLEAKVLFVVATEQHIDDLISAVEDAGVSVEDVMASPFASSIVNLSKSQKIAGSILINIGSETTSFVIYENNIPVLVEVIEIGGNDITNDIALTFKIPIDEAENLKIMKNIEGKYSKKRLFDVIGNRLSEIFEIIEAHLKKIGRNELLPAGIILTGGSAGIEMIEMFGRESLNLPSKIASTNVIFDSKNLDHKETCWSVAYGLSVWGLSNTNDTSVGVTPKGGFIPDTIKWFQKYLP